MGGISDPLAGFGAVAKAKYVLLGTDPTIADRIRSLNLEHVSPTVLKGSEISRRPASAVADEVATLALMRRWFFARKPDAGFLLTGFPATLLQAKVFDEWLDARNESLNGVIAAGTGADSIVQHYRSIGLLIEADDLAA